MFLILIVVLSLLVFLYQYLKHFAGVRYVEDVPGPKQLPIIGHLLDILVTPETLFKSLRKWASKYDVYKLVILPYYVINIVHPDDVEVRLMACIHFAQHLDKAVLLSSRANITKSEIYSVLHPWLQDGLLTSTGDKWQKRRKILTPSFHFSILQQFVTIFGEQSNKMVKKLRAECQKEETNVNTHVTEFALQSICETAMGTTLDSSKPENQLYKDSIYRLGEFLVYRLTRIWLHPNLLFDISSTGREQKKLLRNLHCFTKNVISERRQKNIKYVPPTDDDIDRIGKSNKRMAMLDLLLHSQANGEIDDSGISEEVDTFMFEGHDTTSMGLIFTLMCLANNPDIQDKVYDELFEIFGTSDKPATIQELQRMRYLEMCLKEALRLYPSVPFISRVLSEPMKLANYTLPAGAIVNVHIFDVHRNPKFFPDPERFDPERFSADNCVGRHPFSYIPFSAGPRNCIGQKFALLEEKSVVSAIIRNYKLEAVTRPQDLQFVNDIVLRTKNPVKVKFRPRRRM